MVTWIKNQQGEKFTFPQGMLSKIAVNFETGVDPQKMPVTGPMSNIGLDVDGNAKTITLTGNFVDTNESVTDVNNIRSMKVMKQWFEAVFSGFQTAVEFSSYFDNLSVRGSGPPTVVVDEVSNEEVLLQADFQQTTVYVTDFSYDDDEGDPEKLPFNLTLWVAGI